MINEILQILIITTTVMIFISGVDDVYIDFLYWFLRGRYKSKFPDFSKMYEKPEKPIAILMGAWNESKVIGRTLSYAVGNITYNNYRIFVGVYPNDTATIEVVKRMSLKDPRIIACINSQDGPTTKADNLNNIYASVCEYEKVFGEFEIILVHDAEDFIHPGALKLYNYLIGYQGYHGIQIPVIPLKSRHGGVYHRTYCDAFAEIHTKDMIVRQGMGSFIPFAGTGMGFHRKAIYLLEKNNEILNGKGDTHSYEVEKIYSDSYGRKIELSKEYFKNVEETEPVPLYINNTDYDEDPFDSSVNKGNNYKIPTNTLIKRYTLTFATVLIIGISALSFEGYFNDSGMLLEIKKKTASVIPSIYAGEIQSSDVSDPASDYNNKLNENNTYYDAEYNVLYMKSENGKFIIQESVWSTYISAKKRMDSIYRISEKEKLNCRVYTVQKHNLILYKVVIGIFDDAGTARNVVSKIRKFIKY